LTITSSCTLQLTLPPVSRPPSAQIASTVPGVARRTLKSVGPLDTRWNAEWPSAVQPRGSARVRSTCAATSAGEMAMPFSTSTR